MSALGSVCCVCLTDFVSYRRLVRHVSQGSSRCRWVYQQLDAQNAEAQMPLIGRQLHDANNDSLQAQSCTAGEDLPAMKVPGPLLIVAVAVGIIR